MGRDLTNRAINELKVADVAFCMVDAPAIRWLQGVRPDIQSLHELYGDNKDRRITYREMTDAMLAPLRQGKRVCAMFYGHPGVFVDPTHDAIKIARAEGFEATMLPGISAEDCMVADLGIDPASPGMLSMETTQFMVRQCTPDTTALLVLWQVAQAGNIAAVGFVPSQERIRLLVDKLRRWYRPEHQVVLYEAASLPISTPRMDWVRLDELPNTQVSSVTTLVIPPQDELVLDAEMLTALGYPDGMPLTICSR